MMNKPLLFVALLAGFALVSLSFAGGGFGGGGAGGFGGGFGGGRMTQTDQIRNQIGFTDDEWSVIEPKLQHILEVQAALAPANQRGRGFGGAQPAAQPDPAQTALQELTAALQDQNAAPNALAEKMKVLRDARAKAREALVKAEDDLKRVLTVRQEALLLTMGILD